MEFKERLKTLRQQNGLSQEALAKSIYVSRSAIAKWESGLGIPNDSNVEELCKYFNVKEEWLLDRIDLKKQLKITKQQVFTLITGILGVLTPFIYVLLGFTLTFRVNPVISYMPLNLPSFFDFIIQYAETETATSFCILWFSVAVWASTVLFAVLSLTVPELKRHTCICRSINIGSVVLSLLMFLILFIITVNVNDTIYWFYPKY
ncbi:MAG: helix-turn-helix transcriptional regulator [Clostridiales bacterium]|nr:helix-turn-helix transcriptional regulator [Clostridiales bacterium]